MDEPLPPRESEHTGPPTGSATFPFGRLLHDILTSHVYDVARETPLEHAVRLSRRLETIALFKREDLQPVFSFKLRGAYNRIACLSPGEREQGVIAASAGNHAQGVALSAKLLGIRAIIVMPRTTPEIKVEAVRGMGAEVVLAGDNYSDAKAHCDTLVRETGMIFIHPFDDSLVIAGQGTIGEEILRQAHGRLSAVFVPVGGGGLIAGIAGYIKPLMPHVKIFGVEPFEADAMYQSLAAGHRVRLDDVGIFADGVAVREVGEKTFAIARQFVDGIIRVTNDEICAAIKDAFDDTRSVLEPAGALAVAGLKSFASENDCRDQRLVAILSGANMNFDRLRFVAERAELGEHREALFAVTIPERPGAFRAFCATIGPRVITEFNYRLSSREEAHIFVGIQTASLADASGIATRLEESGYSTRDLSDNEIAKLHLRYMVGGRAAAVQNERLFRFQFPERPGALLQFLDVLGGRWNISLFHYRNHGADFGRVLCAFEVPDEELPSFNSFLGDLSYPFEPERDNPAYDLFLSPPSPPAS